MVCYCPGAINMYINIFSISSIHKKTINMYINIFSISSGTNVCSSNLCHMPIQVYYIFTNL